MNTSLELMKNRVEAIQNPPRRSYANKLDDCKQVMELLVLRQIRQDYPELVIDYKQGRFSYETLLKIYNEMEDIKLQKFMKEYKKKAGVNNANS